MMLKFLQNHMAVRRHPELNRQWLVKHGEPEPQPLPDDLLKITIRAAELGVNCRSAIQEELGEWFVRHAEKATNYIEALLSYPSTDARWVAETAIGCIVDGAVKSTSTGDRVQAVSVLESFAGHRDYDIRMMVVDQLTRLTEFPDSQDSSLLVAMTLVDDNSYYIAEKAVAIIGETTKAASCFSQKLENAGHAAFALILAEVKRLTERNPGMITKELVSKIEGLLEMRSVFDINIVLQTLIHLADTCNNYREEIHDTLSSTLESWLPKTIDSLDVVDSDAHIRVVKTLARTFQRAGINIDHLQSALADVRPRVREGIARVICMLSPRSTILLGEIDRFLESETDWTAKLWLAAAWEAVSNSRLPEERWPIVPDIWQMVFFEDHAERNIPVGVRFTEEHPLNGRLEQEGWGLYLYWPRYHGIVSSTTLIDNYGPIECREPKDLRLDGLLGCEVEITGTWYQNVVYARSIQLRSR